MVVSTGRDVHCGGDGGDDVSPSYAGDGGEERVSVRLSIRIDELTVA